MLDRDAARDLHADFGFEVAEQPFRARLKGGDLVIERGPGEGAQAIVRAPAATPIAAHVYVDVPLSELPVAVEGDAALFARFVSLVSLPEKMA